MAVMVLTLPLAYAMKTQSALANSYSYTSGFNVTSQNHMLVDESVSNVDMQATDTEELATKMNTIVEKTLAENIGDYVRGDMSL